MGKERAIIFLGTAIASLALVLGMITVLPTTTDLEATSTGVSLTGHFTMTIADPDGTIVHYAQMDNFATDALKVDIVDAITGVGAMDTYRWIAICSGGDAADDWGLDECTGEFTASGKCQATIPVATATDPISVSGASTNPASQTIGCEITVDVTEGNRQIENLSISVTESGGNDAGAISVVSTPVTVFGNQVVTTTFTINANN